MRATRLRGRVVRRVAAAVAAVACLYLLLVPLQAYAVTSRDVNGDGLADLLVIGLSDGGNPNTLYVVFGGRDVVSRRLDAISPVEGFAIRTRDYINEVGWLGDVDGDGLADIALATLAQRSRSIVVFGRRSTADVDADSNDDGVHRYPSGLGMSTTGVGDVNADGIDELVFSRSPGDSARTVIFGRRDRTPTGRVTLRAPRSRGFVVRHPRGIPGVVAAGDANGDGVDDFAVHTGGQYECEEWEGGGSCGGPSYVVYGRRRPVDVELGRRPQVRTRGGHRLAGYAVGTTLAAPFGSPGDFDGDGLDDLFAPGWGTSGPTIEYGRSVGSRAGSRPAEALIGGWNGAGVLGDVHGDALADVLVQLSDVSRTLAVVLGRPRRAPIDARRRAMTVWRITASPGATLFASPGAVGDVNGDGFDDIALYEVGGTTPNRLLHVVLGGKDAPPSRLSELGTRGFSIE